MARKRKANVTFQSSEEDDIEADLNLEVQIPGDEGKGLRKKVFTARGELQHDSVMQSNARRETLQQTRESRIASSTAVATTPPPMPTGRPLPAGSDSTFTPSLSDLSQANQWNLRFADATQLALLRAQAQQVLNYSAPYGLSHSNGQVELSAGLGTWPVYHSGTPTTTHASAENLVTQTAFLDEETVFAASVATDMMATEQSDIARPQISDDLLNTWSSTAAPVTCTPTVATEMTNTNYLVDATPTQLEPCSRTHIPQGVGTLGSLRLLSSSATRACNGSTIEPTNDKENNSNTSSDDANQEGPSEENTSPELRSNQTTGKVAASPSTPAGKRKSKVTSVQQITDPIVRRITQAAWPYMRARVATVDGFPKDQILYDMVHDSYEDAYNEVEKKLGKDDLEAGGYSRKPSAASYALIEDRVSQTRGSVKDKLCLIFSSEFPTIKSCAETNVTQVNANKEEYNFLAGDKDHAKHRYFFEDPRNISKPNSLYRHSFIGKAINLAFFEDHASLGVAHRELFEDSDGALPATVIALVVTAAKYALDEYSSGYRQKRSKTDQRKGLQFSANYRKTYKWHLRQLLAWEKRNQTSFVKFRKDLLLDARQHANVTVGRRLDDEDSDDLNSGGDLAPEMFD